MKNIQLDMFEVQLGSAILLQFRTEESIVRVLADAGILAKKNYDLDHVHKKLFPAINDFDEGTNVTRLDLIIGTHYDADHLEGLVPIINDQSVEIGEAWMPPVANDTETTPVDASIKDHQLLAHQFSQEGAEKKLFEYLTFKARVCDEIAQLQIDTPNSLSEERFHTLTKSYSVSGNSGIGESFKPQNFSSDLDEFLNDFNRYIQDADSEVGHVDCSHADCEFDSETDFLAYSTDRQANNFYYRTWKNARVYEEPNKVSLAYIKRSAAKEAINAASLYKVVQALKKRNIPIVCQTIPNGNPRRFIWKDTSKRFIPREHSTSTGPELLLLAPSDGLVKKHQVRLPIGDYMMLAYKSVPIKYITPSNQLSYVIRFEYKGQGILITGDAGFVDFKPEGGSYYYENLINKLTPLHLIQVAHHGGNNAHFYRVLLASSYPKQTENSFLLLSHATYDKHRPSKEFGYFVAKVLKDGDDIKLLFTSEPSLEKVKDFKDLIYPLKTSRYQVGDVQVVFDGQRWDVLKHAIAV